MAIAYLPNQPVREYPLHTIPGLNTHLSLFDCHEDQDALIFSFFSDSPGPVKAVGIVVILRASDIRHGDNHYRNSRFLKQDSRDSGDLLLIRRGNHIGEVINKALWFWEGAFCPG